MSYIVVLSGALKSKVVVSDATCSHEAETLARKRHPEHANSSVYDISRSANNSVSSSSKKKLPD